MQRQGDEPVGVGRGGHRRHDAGCELLGNPREPTEVGRHELHIRTTVDEESLRRSEESGEIADARLGEHRIEVDQQRAENGEFGPVVTAAERVEECRRLARPERDPETVSRSEERGGVRRGHELRGHARTLRADWRSSVVCGAPGTKRNEQLGSVLRRNGFDVVGAETAGHRQDHSELFEDLFAERTLGNVGLEADTIIGGQCRLEVLGDALDEFLAHHLGGISVAYISVAHATTALSK